MTDGRRSLRPGLMWSAGSTFLVGILGLVGLSLAARGLGPAVYADFSLVWAVFFGVGGVFAGLQQEVTRAVSTRPCVPGVARMLPQAAGLVFAVAVSGAVAMWVVESGASGLVVGTGLLGLGVLTFVAGNLAAHGDWGLLAVLLVTDALVRTGAIAGVVISGAAELIPVAVVSGAVVWVVLLLAPSYRRTLAEHGDPDTRGFLRRSGIAMAAAGCSSIVVGGLPLIVEVVGPGGLDASAGSVIAALTLIRSALLLMVYGCRPLILRQFLGAHDPARTFRAAWVTSLLVGLVFVLLSGVAAPPVLVLLLGDAYDIGNATAAALAAGAVGIALLVVGGLWLLAQDRHAASAAGWVTALVATVVCASVAPTSVDSVVLAAAVAPWVGVAVHACLVGRRAPSRGGVGASA